MNRMREGRNREASSRACVEQPVDPPVEPRRSTDGKPACEMTILRQRRGSVRGPPFRFVDNDTRNDGRGTGTHPDVYVRTTPSATGFFLYTSKEEKRHRRLQLTLSCFAARAAEAAAKKRPRPEWCGRNPHTSPRPNSFGLLAEAGE
jgi:hypothetical protein